MVRESRWFGESYFAMLRGSRGRQDLYKVRQYSLGTINNADK